MRRRVHLHGTFADFHDGPIEVIAETVWQAIEAVVSQIKGFAPDAVFGRKRLQVAGFSTIESLHQPTDVEDIHIVPALTFGKNGGLVQTLIGVALIVVGAMFIFTPLGALAINVMILGATMLVGGILEMLTPQPKMTQSSHYLPNSESTVAIGTPIPLLYGTMMCGGQILSLQIDARAQGT